MPLSESQKKHLRGLAHSLKPCIHVGDAGVTAAVLAELGNALEHHELLKVKVRCGHRGARTTAVAALVDGTGATLLQRIGNVAVLYRPAAENPRILLPEPRCPPAPVRDTAP